MQKTFLIILLLTLSACAGLDADLRKAEQVAGRVDSYPNETPATGDEFVYWDTTAGAVKNVTKETLDTLYDQDAAEVPFTATGNTVATNTQAAIVEVQTELDAATTHISNTADPHNVLLSQVGSPTGDVTFNVAENTITYNFTNPSGGMLYNWTGAAAGHAFELKQSGGNPGTDMHLLHVEASDADPVMAHFVPGSATSRAIKVNIPGENAGPGRYNVDASGKMTWGDGTSAVDTTLERTEAGVLSTGTINATGVQVAGAGIGTTGGLAAYNDTVSGVTSNKGLVETGTNAPTVGLREDCTDGYGLQWTSGTTTWGCAAWGSGSGDSLTAITDGDITIKMGDSLGATKTTFTDSADAEVASIDSDGKITATSYETTAADGERRANYYNSIAPTFTPATGDCYTDSSLKTQCWNGTAWVNEVATHETTYDHSLIGGGGYNSSPLTVTSGDTLTDLQHHEYAAGTAATLYLPDSPKKLSLLSSGGGILTVYPPTGTHFINNSYTTSYTDNQPLVSDGNTGEYIGFQVTSSGDIWLEREGLSQSAGTAATTLNAGVTSFGAGGQIPLTGVGNAYIYSIVTAPSSGVVSYSHWDSYSSGATSRVAIYEMSDADSGTIVCAGTLQTGDDTYNDDLTAYPTTSNPCTLTGSQDYAIGAWVEDDTGTYGIYMTQELQGDSSHYIAMTSFGDALETATATEASATRGVFVYADIFTGR